LLGRARTMFTLANMMHLFADKFAGLRGSGFALPPVSTSAC